MPNGVVKALSFVSWGHFSGGRNSIAPNTPFFTMAERDTETPIKRTPAKGKKTPTSAKKGRTKRLH